MKNEKNFVIPATNSPGANLNALGAARRVEGRIPGITGNLLSFRATKQVTPTQRSGIRVLNGIVNNAQ
jgi:hypothetical protein